MEELSREELIAIIHAQQETINNLREELNEEPEIEDVSPNDDTLHYDTVEAMVTDSVNWPRTLPLQKAVVAENGRSYHYRPKFIAPDWLKIGSFAILDLGAPVWIQCATRTDTSQNNRKVQTKNLMAYEGDILDGMYGWPAWAKEAYLTTHDEPGGPVKRTPGMAADGSILG